MNELYTAIAKLIQINLKASQLILCLQAVML